MTLALSLAAIRRHPCSVVLSALLLAGFASLLGVLVPLALGVWAAAALIVYEAWYALEPSVLRRVGGYRDPTHDESALLENVLATSQLQPLIAVQPGLAIARGLRCLVVSRDALELFEERSLSGLLVQAVAPVHRADLAGVLLTWLANLPVVGAWYLSRGCGVLGRLLGVVVGESLVLPLVVWRDAFLRWSSRVFGSIIVGLLGAMLLSDGFAAAGLGLLTAWLLVPGIHALLAWESRRVERVADQATIAAGFGAPLLEALELLNVIEPRPGPSRVLGLLCRPGAALTTRTDHIRTLLRRS